MFIYFFYFYLEILSKAGKIIKWDKAFSMEQSFQYAPSADSGDMGGINMPPHDRRMLLVWGNLENSRIYCVYGFATAIYNGLFSLLTGGKCLLTSILLNLKIKK